MYSVSIMFSYHIPSRIISEDYFSGDFSYGMIDSSKYIKKQLDGARDLLNRIYYNDAYSRMSYVMDYCKDLRRIIKRRYNAQNVSNGWLKIYEILCYYQLLRQDSCYYFANCEMPGSFILAVNHYSQTLLDGRIQWYASSIVADGSSNNYFGDRYKLYCENSSNWIMGDCNGDTTDPSNIDLMRSNLLSKTNGRLVDLYTSDGGIDVSSDYNDQELMQARLFLGQIVMGLVTLDYHGNMVIKTFTYFEPYSLSLIFILSGLFRELYICKPMSSKASNSEVYIVCKDYILCPSYVIFLLASRLVDFDTRPLVNEEFLHCDVLFMDAIYRSYALIYRQIHALREIFNMYIRHHANPDTLALLCRQRNRYLCSLYLMLCNIRHLDESKYIMCSGTI